MRTYDFQYNEFKQAGADHSIAERARAYDSKMDLFRDYKYEAMALQELLDIQPSHRILDIGAGTGALSIELAGFCKEVVSVDVSDEMLYILREKSASRSISNITTERAGFLTFRREDSAFDRIISNVVLHHLPDFWKLVGLRNMRQHLKDNGLFYLADVVFSFAPEYYESEINGWLSELEKQTDEEFIKDGILHVKEEFSTYDWIMDSIISTAGFEIVKKTYLSRFRINYVLAKK